ncbi:MAG: thioredoxin domain-containing protein [Patescibacteria group bacterium]
MLDEITQLIPQEPQSPKAWYKYSWLWIIIALVVVWFGSAFVINMIADKNTLLNSAKPLEINSKAISDNTLATSDDPSLGLLSAPVVIVEFGDFECPYCREASAILKQVIKQYPDAVRLIFRDFPVTSIHSQAVSAAVAANCALEQQKFWEYHDLIFAQQENLGDNLYLTLARSLNLNEERFNNCLASSQILTEVEEDFYAGIDAGVSGTPTFFVNGKIVQGSPPYEYWSKIITGEVKDKFNK